MADSDSEVYFPPRIRGVEEDDGELYWLAGENIVIVVREWQYGDLAGFTPLFVYALIDENLAEHGMADNVEWANVTSENIAKWLAAGKLHKIAGPGRSPAPPTD